MSWSSEGADALSVELGLFGDPRSRLTGLPSGATVLIVITAPNSAGESAAFIVRGLVP